MLHVYMLHVPECRGNYLTPALLQVKYSVMKTSMSLDNDLENELMGHMIVFWKETANVLDNFGNCNFARV